MSFTYTSHSANNSRATRLPLIAVMANSGESGDLGVQSVDNKYLQAVIGAAGAVPIVVPTIFSPRELQQVIDRVDGIVLTGDGSNIDPARYGVCGTVASHGPFDRERDSVALWLIEQALSRDIPMLGICRGLQEMNVALGGTLRTDVVENTAFSLHSDIDMAEPPASRYAPCHTINLAAEGLLRQVLDTAQVDVNSLHEQAVDRIGEGLVLNACAEDGIVEALHHPGKRFFLGVQWHAEFNAENNPVSKSIFSAFSEAVFTFHQARESL